jgi:hypothetical protein
MKRGFRIVDLLMDGQFEPIRGDLAELQITLNTVASGEHVPEIETGTYAPSRSVPGVSTTHSHSRKSLDVWLLS